MPRQQIDWPALREAYRTTVKPLRQLALEYNVSERAVAAKSKAEKWPELRVAYQEATAARVQREQQDRQVRAELTTLDTVRTIGRSMLTQFARLVNARAIELDAGDFVNVAKLLLLLEGQLPAESVDVKLRRLVEKPPEELSDDELDSQLADLADEWLRSRSAGGAAQGEGEA